MIPKCSDRGYRCFDFGSRSSILILMIYLVFAGLCFGTIGLFVKGIGSEISTLLLVSIRLLATALLVFLYQSTRGTLGKLRISSKTDLLRALVGGLLGFAVTFSLYFKSLTLIPVSKAVFLHYFAFPFSTILYSAVILKEKVSKHEVIALMGSIGGLFLIYNVALFSETASVLGYTMAFISGITYSAVLIVLKYFGKKKTTFQTLFWPVLLGGIVLLPVAFIEGITFHVSGQTLMCLLGLILISTLPGYFLLAYGLKSVKAGISSIVLIVIEPLSAVLMAIIFLGETLSGFSILGGALIVISGVYIYFARARLKKEKGIEPID